MIIELMGLPGSGKTFLSFHLVTTLCQDGHIACNLIDKSRTAVTYKILFKCFKIVIKINPSYKKLKKELMNIVKEYERVKPAYNKVYIKNYIESLVLDYFIYRKYGDKHGVFILDEGVGQQLANMIVNYNLDEGTIKKLLDSLNFTLHPIRLKCSIDEAYNSIKKRNRHVCYIDELNENDLLSFLKKYEKACEIVYDNTNGYTLDRESEIHKNVRKIYHIIGL